MERLPDYLKRLNFGSTVHFFNELDICIHRKQNHFNIIKCSTGETTKLDLKHTCQFMACNKANKLFFVRRTHGKPPHIKLNKSFDNDKIKSYLHFYVYDLKSDTYKKSKPFCQLTPSSDMSSFHLNDDNIICICSNGDVLTVNIDTLDVEVSMRLRNYIELEGRLFSYRPWYRVDNNSYTTIVNRQRYWYKTSSYFDGFSDEIDYLYVKIDVIDKTHKCIPGKGTLYETSVYLEDSRVWVHQRSSNTNMMNVTSSLYDIKKGDEVIWQFEIPHRASDVMLNGWECRNIFNFSETLFVICFNKMIYLCNLQDLTLKSIFFNTGMHDVFYDKEKGYIIPIYNLGTTENMITLDDFMS